MRTLDVTLNQLIRPVIWLEDTGDWSSDWDVLRQSPLINCQNIKKRPSLSWGWDCSDAVVRGVRTEGSGTVWIWGEPEGQEREALLDILLMAGRGHSRLSHDSHARLSVLSHAVDIGILTTPA